MQRLHSQVALIVFFSFLLLGAVAAVALLHVGRAHQHEVTQTLHRDLAAFVVDHYLLFDQGQPDLVAAKNTFHDLMILGPNFEFYVLDPQGAILAYSTDPSNVERTHVAVDKVRAYLSEVSSYPLYGDDPRSSAREKVFNVAPIITDGELQGYLYVILGSEIYDGVAGLVSSSQIMRWGMIFLGLGLLFSFLVALGLVSLITRPLSHLTQQVRAVRDHGFANDKLSGGNEIAALSRWRTDSDNEIHLLGSTFACALDTLSEQYAKVRDVDTLRKELIAHVSHDLRTPLASLLGYLETWEINQHNITSAQSAHYIAIATKSANKIYHLIEQLFELAHLDSGNVAVDFEPLSLADLVQDVLQKFTLVAKRKGIALDLEPKDSSIQTQGDIEKLDRVFTNLIENALRHTPKGGKITVRLSNQGTYVAVQVVDSGVGIPAQDLPRIFEPHYKAGNSVRGNIAHGGLGLAITQKLLALHKTAISVHSVVDCGTTFEFKLPAA